MNAAELLGYVASVLVAVSLTMSNVWRLRWINLFGAIAFTIYGGLIGAAPVFVVNGFICVVNVVYLWRMSRSQDAFEWIKVEDSDQLVERLLTFHEKDLKRFFPDFDLEKMRGRPDDHWLLVLRNAVPVGLCVVTLNAPQPGVAHVDLDYVTPDYRDGKNGQFLYNKLCQRLIARGMHTMQSSTTVEAHRGYLKKMGFTPAGGSQTTSVRPLSP